MIEPPFVSFIASLFVFYYIIKVSVLKTLLLSLCRWSAYVVDGKVKVLNVEEAPSDFKVSGGDVILGQI